jgi:dipeptidyl aminopeptidase/acylaminoacyl peptidase
MRCPASVAAGCVLAVAMISEQTVVSAQTMVSAQTGKHAFTADDWAALHSASAVAVSPNGATILWKASWGGEKGPSNEEWRLIATDGTNSRKLDLPEHFTPYGFTKDGASLYGCYDVNKLPQFAVFPLAGIKKSTAPSLLVALPKGIHSALLSPDGSRYAILAGPTPPDDLSDVHTVVEPELTSLYVVGADGTGGRWWCPDLKNIADNPGAGNAVGAGAMAWAPGGAALAVVSATPKIGYHYVRSFLDVCTVEGSRRVAEIANAVAGIAWDNGGRDLAFLSTTTSVLATDHVWTVPASGGTPVDRTPKLDGSAMALAGDPRGKVWALVDRGVQNEIDSFQDGALTTAFHWPEGYIASPPVFSDLAGAPAQLAIDVGDPTHSTNIAVPSGGALRKITAEGDEQIAKVDLGPVRVVHWTSKEGIALEGIATFPAAYAEGRRYPFLVLPHGGPEGNDLLGLDAFSRVVAGLGYVVLQPQYRGSTGYGSDFLEAIYQHFGDRAYRDVDSATDFAIAQGWADPNKLAIFGWSAGGFMTSWTVTQTRRYRAAIEGAGITDWASFLWTSDVQQIDYDGRWPEKDASAIGQFSAAVHASQVTTPILILHGAADERVPIFQGREFFEALAANGKTTRMVTYPGSPHFPKLWEQRRDVFREVAAWLARYNP